MMETSSNTGRTYSIINMQENSQVNLDSHLQELPLTHILTKEVL